MTWTTWLAIYFVAWWLVLFTTLPFGVRNASEAGEQLVDGAEAGAPVKPMMVRKLLATTVITAVLIGGVYLLTAYGVIDIRGYLSGK